MGLNLIALKKPIGIVDYNVFEDKEEEIARFGPDEKLLWLFSEEGLNHPEPFITFTKENLLSLIKICETIDDGSFIRTDHDDLNVNKEYEKKYANETMFDFYQRWDYIIKSLKNALYQINWKKEHLVIHISA